MRSIAITTLAFLSALTLGSVGNVANAAPTEKENKVDSRIVTVKSGDNLSIIADKKDSTVKRLFYANKDIKNPDLIYPGDELRVPGSDEKLERREMPSTITAAAPAPVAQPAAVASAPAVQPAPQPQPQVQQATPVASGGSAWDQLAQCESGGNWSINTGNGYYGGLQFTIQSWQAVGGSGLPSEASRSEQIQRAQSLKAIQGWGAWPACTSKLGLR